jgi:putative colanic acid biosynthesis glycosyltransferase WcaI
MHRKVLLTTSYYWPEDVANAPYVTGLAEHLSESGDDVVVATSFAHYPEWKSSANGRMGATETRKGVRIRRRWHYVPSSQSAAHRAAYELSCLVSGLTALPPRWKPDVVVGVSPTLAGGALAAAASRLYHAPYGLVFQDIVGQAAAQSGVAGGARVAGFVKNVELRLAKGAAAVGIIAEGFRRYVEEGGIEQEKIYRLRNWTRRVDPIETRPETRKRFGWREKDFICTHGGNMGQKQGLDNLLDTAELLHGDGIRIALVGDGNDRDRLEREARARKLDNVDFIELQGPGKWEATMQASDILLVNQRASVMDMSLPSKLTSYFASGRPIVAAVSPDSETAWEIEAAGAGVVVPSADPEALRDAILRFKNDQTLIERIGATGGDYAESVLSRDAALAEYDRFMDRIAAAGS